MSEWNHTLVGQLLDGRYRVDAFVGRGGMADVYKVWDQQRAVFLAMKVLTADLSEDLVFLQRFQREAQALESLQHPNIVRFYGLITRADAAYILMDFIDGMSLRKEIALHRQGMSSRRILEVMRPVCAALHYAHQMGRVHCDIKPANIMVHRNGSVFVTDFGVSHMSESRTATLAGAGTPAFMAPEQFQQHKPTPASDIYALGVTLFEMITGGQRPFTGDAAQETGPVTQKIIWEKTHLDPPSPRKFSPDVSPQMEGVVLRCLQRDPPARYPTVLAFYEAVQAAVEAEGPDTDAPTLFDPLAPLPAEAPGARLIARPRSRLRSAARALAALLVVGAVILGAALRFGRPSAAFPTPFAPSPTAVAAALAASPSAAATAVGAVTAARPSPSPSPQPTRTLPPTPTATHTGGGGWIAFASSRSGSVQVWRMDAQGSQRRQVTDMTNGACDPAPSPDGELLAFISPCHGPRPSYPGAKIYLTTLDGSVSKALPLPLGGFDPAWSPDGRWIAFSYTYEGKISFGLYNIETRAVTEMAGRGTRSTHAAWRDRDTLAFISDDRRQGEIWQVGVDGKSLEQVYQGSLNEVLSYPAWSPGGQWMVATLKVNSSPNTTLLRLDVGAGGKVTAAPFLVEPFAATGASFSPDGQWVAFEGWPEATNREIFIASADGKTVHRITNHEAQDFHPAWGPGQ